MRRLVHEDEEAELTAADDGDGRDEGERGRPDRIDGHGGEDRGPGVGDEARAP